MTNPQPLDVARTVELLDIASTAIQRACSEYCTGGCECSTEASELDALALRIPELAKTVSCCFDRNVRGDPCCDAHPDCYLRRPVPAFEPHHSD